MHIVLPSLHSWPGGKAAAFLPDGSFPSFLLCSDILTLSGAQGPVWMCPCCAGELRRGPAATRNSPGRAVHPRMPILGSRRDALARGCTGTALSLGNGHPSQPWEHGTSAGIPRAGREPRGRQGSPEPTLRGESGTCRERSCT